MNVNKSKENQSIYYLVNVFSVHAGFRSLVLLTRVLLFQKSGVHLSRTTLINHCKTNPAFLSLVTDLVPKAIKVNLIYSTGR